MIAVDGTAASHPFWTGNQRVLDEAGQVEKFRRRYGSRHGWAVPTRRTSSSNTRSRRAPWKATPPGLGG